MTEYARTHEVNERNTWGTLNYFYRLDDSGPCIVIPIKQLEGMSKEEIGNAVLNSTQEAMITSLLSWNHHWSWGQFHGVGAPNSRVAEWMPALRIVSRKSH